MEEGSIYVKSDAGREEMRTRARQMPQAMRSILLMVDGQRTLAQLRAVVAGSKAPPDALEQLEAAGLIEPMRSTAATPAAPAPSAAQPAAPQASPQAAPPATPPQQRPPPPPAPAPPPLQASPRGVPLDIAAAAEPASPALVLGARPAPSQASPPLPPVPLPVAPAAPAPIAAAAPVAPQPAGSSGPTPAESQRYQAAYSLMTDIVREYMGMRGYFMQLKIERAQTIADLLALLPDLRTALAKARGEAIANDLISRITLAAR